MKATRLKKISKIKNKNNFSRVNERRFLMINLPAARKNANYILINCAYIDARMNSRFVKVYKSIQRYIYILEARTYVRYGHRNRGEGSSPVEKKAEAK